MYYKYLDVFELDFVPPPGAIVDGDALYTRWLLEEARDQKRKEENLLLGSVRRKAESMLRDVRYQEKAMRLAMEQELAEKEQALIHSCEANWIQRQVTQLVETEQTEQQLIESVADRITDSLRCVLTAWRDEQPHDAILLDKLNQEVQSMAREGALTLRIHPDWYDQAEHEFGQRLSVVADATLTKNQAVLASTLMSVEIDLARHFAALLNWLNSAAENAEGEDDRH